MNKRMVRCYKAYAEAGGFFNNPVFYLAQDGYRLELATCINCGEIFVIDFENPRLAGRSIAEIAGEACCPSCHHKLMLSLRRYPETFVGRGGRIGSFVPATWIPPQEQSLIMELWEVPASLEP